MRKPASGFGDTLSQWLEAEGLAPAEIPGAIADVARVKALLVEAARESRTFSYSELLGQLGHRFTRPKMRAMCSSLEAIDRDAVMTGEPPLAVLVVRESDRMPGQSWSTGRSNAPAWTGPDARQYVDERQRAAFDHWTTRPVPTSL